MYQDGGGKAQWQVVWESFVYCVAVYVATPFLIRITMIYPGALVGSRSRRVWEDAFALLSQVIAGRAHVMLTVPPPFCSDDSNHVELGFQGVPTPA